MTRHRPPSFLESPFLLIADALEGIIKGISYLWNKPKRERETEMQRQKIEDERQQQEQLAREHEQRQSRVRTSTNHIIRGYKVVKQLRMVSVSGERSGIEAERKFLLEVERCGGNGALNVKVIPHAGGYFSAQGDAVVLAN